MAQGQLVKQLLERRDPLLGLIFALTRDYDVAEEIFQEVAMVIIEEDRRGTRVGNFLAWAREIARRRIADYYKKRARREAIEHAAGSLADVITQAFAENEPLLEGPGAHLQALLDCMNRLPGRSREVIEGRYGQRKSMRDLAAAMGWQEGSVKVALTRARKMLADCIASQLRLREAT